jgi:hypothetical protein
MFCAPHAIHLSDRAGDLDRMIRYAGPKLAHLHIDQPALSPLVKSDPRASWLPRALLS